MWSKRGDKVISVYWFVILFIVAGAVVYMAALFYGAPYNVKEIEQGILTNKIASCLAEGGYFRENVLYNEDLRENFLERCDLNFKVEDVYNWNENEQYYVEVGFYEFDENSLSGLGRELDFGIVEGNINLKTTAMLLEKPEVKRDVDYVVIHFTAGTNLEGAISTIRDNKLSVHYMIDRDGFLVSKENEDDVVPTGFLGRSAFKEEDKVAQHAGCYDPRARELRTACESDWPEEGEKCCIDVNRNSIGIELVNLGYLCGGSAFENSEHCVDIYETADGRKWEKFSEEQMRSLINLVSGIVSRHDIPLDRFHIFGHDEVAPGYKSDPGPAFDWDFFMNELKYRREFPLENEGSFYVLNKEDNEPYVVRILSIVGKNEKNVL